MSALTTETDIDCPFCGESITIVVDLSVPGQDYIEDCFVCCRPIRIRYVADDGELISIHAEA
ncbi:MAG: CPXCG motif-containing cysteine-rich protein [Gammaproteobacteria bacterium]|nr:MAG: CPXCG motif-containing cysteine-rich protein [Gammaproteobacteria bacterium]